MRPSTFDDKKDLRISASTGAFINILRKYNELYDDVYSALGLTFSDEICTDIINALFYTEYAALERRLHELLIRSIENNLDREEPTEI